LPSASNNVARNPELDTLIKDVKAQIRKFHGGIKEQIERTGDFLKEKKLVKDRDICVEIKSNLKEEIEDQIISERTIDRCCPEEWKRKTKPKKERHLSFFEDKNELEQGTVTNTAVEMSSQSRGTTLLLGVGDTNSDQGVSAGDPADRKSNKIHKCDSSHEVSGKQNKESLLHFKFLIQRRDLWKDIIIPSSRQRGEDMICINAVLDKRTGIATITIE